MNSEYPVEWVSAEQVYARVQRTLRSYFAAGALTDDMFDEYARDLLEETGQSNLPRQETLLPVVRGTADLPDYVFLEEVWYCAPDRCRTLPFGTLRGVEYLDAQDEIIEQPSPVAGCLDCGELLPTDVRRMRLVVQNREYWADFSRSFPLFPGNVRSQDACLNCGPQSIHGNRYTITGKRKMAVSVPGHEDAWSRAPTGFQPDGFCPQGYVNIVYRDLQKDAEGFVMMPDHVFARNTLFNFLMYRSFEDLWHNASDESQAQVGSKMAFYKNEYEAEFTRLSTYNKTPTFAGQIKRGNKRRSQMVRYRIS